MVPAALAVFLVACGQESSDAGNQEKPGVLKVWAHSGQEGERDTIKQQAERFDQLNADIRVDLTILPESSYNAQVQAAALANELPDVLEFDGPFLYNYVWQGKLQPLDKLLPRALPDTLLSSVIQQGTFQEQLYSVAMFDSGLALFANRRRLAEAGVRIPASLEDAWSVSEFDQALEALAQKDDDGRVLDLKLNYSGEWFTYAFSPVLQSAGADLIDRTDYQTSRGVLDSDAAVSAMSRVQSWIIGHRVDPNLDDAAFVQQRVALSWVGHWEYPRYKNALGDDLLLLPLPDFGRGVRTGQGSWNWGVAAGSDRKEAAIRFLQFLLQPNQVLEMTAANGAVPATREAVDRSELYKPGGPLHLYVEQLSAVAVPRPRTAAYPVITSAFQEAFDDIRNGGDVREALQNAAETIDQDIKDNQDYRMAR
jgi:multiple sugar transport system substrate-binding protein